MSIRIPGLMLAAGLLLALSAALLAAGGVAARSFQVSVLSVEPAGRQTQARAIEPEWGAAMSSLSEAKDQEPEDSKLKTHSPHDTCALTWSVVPGPGADAVNPEIRAVAALSPYDVWAVGYHDAYETLVEHWDGSAWTVMRSPNVGDKNENFLYGVSAVAGNDVWAVGSYYNSGTGQTLVEHWNGREWSVVPSPNVGTRDNFLKAVVAVSADDVWAVGYYYDVSIGQYQTLVEHWDGSLWSVEHSPNTGLRSNELHGVAAVAADDVWAVGYYYGAEDVPQTLVEHWDGTEWNVVRSAKVGTSSNELHGVAAVSANDVWAVGSYYSGTKWQTLVEHWDGREWSAVPSPNVGAQASYLTGITAVAQGTPGGEVWAVGYSDDAAPGTLAQTLVEHWDGREWSVVPSPNVDASSNNYLNAVAAVAAGDVWALGNYSNGSTYRTLVEHYALSCDPIFTPTDTPTPPPTLPATTPTTTPTLTPSNTPTNTPGPALIAGHVTWQGPPAQPDNKQALPVSMTLGLQSGGHANEYTGLSTDSSGVFTVPAGVANGSYYWRVKGPKYLANSGPVLLTRGETTGVEMGLMEAGDCNDDNQVTVSDFIILKNTYGKSGGQPGYDDRAEFTGEGVVNSVDFNLLKGNFGHVGASPIFTVTPIPSLLDRARLHTWRDLGSLRNSAFRESDITYDTATNKYYLFSTGSYTGSGSVSMYVASRPEDLVAATPITVAEGVYPSIVKDPSTGYWHLYAENFRNAAIQHFVSTGPPASPSSFMLENARLNFQVVDVQVRKHPTNGKWYAVGFPIGSNQPLMILCANDPSGGPNGTWTLLGQVFADAGPPPWANYARPDPNLVFTADGRAWVFFTGNAQSPIIHRAAIVEVDITTGKAIGSAVALSAGAGNVPLPGWHNGANLSDLNFVSVPGQPDRIFGFSNDNGPEINTLDMNWGALELEPFVAPSDGRTPADLVRLDMTRGFDVAAGIQGSLLGDSAWGSEGLVIRSGDGGAYSYLAASRLKDLTEMVEFTPSSIRPGAINEVANIGGHDYTAGARIDVQIDAAGEIVAVVTGNDNTTITLGSGITAQEGARYLVVVHRTGETFTLTVNGDLKATETYPAMLSGLEQWSLGAQARIAQPARYPFLGTIHSFTVLGAGQ